MVINFQRRKDDTLSRLDKSSKKSWDKKITSLCEKINSLKDYYTTSSCSGRILLMVSLEKKQKDLFLKVYHDLVSVGELKKELREILLMPPTHSRLRTKFFSDYASTTKSLAPTATPRMRSPKVRVIDGELVSTKIKLSTMLNSSNLVKFKQEPCILHVACSDLKAAQKIHDAAKNSGWKHCGIIATGKRFVVELSSSEKLEFPIMKNLKILVDDDFLKIVSKQANENLKKSWEKIERLKHSI